MTPTRILITLAVGAACCAGAYLAIKGWRHLRRPPTVGVGDQPRHTFTDPLTFGHGIRSLVDLRGLPTYVLTWGTG